MTLPQEYKKRIDDQARAVIFMPMADLACESSLMVTKWPEYRFITPLAATKLFVVEFRRAYAFCLRTNVDLLRSENSKAGSNIHFLRPGTGETTAWRARQKADAFGLPYPVYLRFCFDFAMRRKRNRLPHINQLFPSNPGARDAWALEFEKFWTDDHQQLAYDTMKFMPQFADLNSRSLPARKTFAVEFLRDVSRRITNLDDFVSGYVVRRNYLSSFELADVVGKNPVAIALTRALNDVRTGVLQKMPFTVSGADRMQACFGLPGVSGVGDPCDECPTRASCSSLRELAEEKVLATSGYLDPRKEYHDRKNREYVKAHRDRKRSVPTPS